MSEVQHYPLRTPCASDDCATLNEWYRGYLNGQEARYQIENRNGFEFPSIRAFYEFAHSLGYRRIEK